MMNRGGAGDADDGSIYRQVFTAHPIPMLVYDLETLAILEVNDAAVATYGYTRDEFLAMTIADIRPPEDVPALLENIKRVVGGRDEAGIWRHRHKDGQVVEVEITSHTVDWAGRRGELVMALDVTERRRTERALQASERLFALTFRASPALMSIIRLPERTIVDASDSLCGLLGYAREELIGHSLEELGLWADPAEPTRLRSQVANQGGLYGQPIRLHTRSQGTRDLIVAYERVEVDGRSAGLGSAIDVTDLLDAQELAAARREQLEHLLDSSPTTLYVLRLVDDALLPILVTDNVTRVLGFTTEEVKDPSFWARNVHPDDAAAGAVAVARLLAEGHAAHEYRFRHSDGTYRWIRDEMRVSRWDDERPSEIIGSWSDISAEREARSALNESENRFRLAFENAPIGMALVGLDDRFLQVNRALCSMLGRTQAELLASTVAAVTHPDDVEIERQARREAAAAGGELVVVQRYLHADGRTVLGRLSATLVRDTSGNAAYFIGQIEDITHRVAAERAVRESERRFRALVEHASDAITLTDAGGDVLYASPMAGLVLGTADDALTGRAFVGHFDADDRDRLRATFEEARASADAALAFEGRVSSPDGRRRTIEGRLTNMLAEPSVGAIVANYRDVTVERRLQEQLEQAQRLESIGRLAGGVAHDFNNLLTAILGYTEMLEGRMAGSADADALGEIRLASERARDLTRQLLTFARRQMTSPRALDLNALVSSTAGLLERLLGEHITIELSLADGLWPIEADSGQLEQVLVNLAVNARDAMPDGGRLLVETANVLVDDGSADGPPGMVPGSYVRLAVADTGAGMTRETRANIFEPFFTTKPVGEGTGLGLATVFGIVTSAGGHIAVASEPGRGSTFTVHLPRTTDRRVEAPPPAQAAIRGGSESVLVVEDDAGVRDLVVRVLAAAGYEVMAAANGSEAVALVEARRGPVDLVVTDVIMPGMSGREVAEQVAARSPGARVLFVSGYTQNTIGHRGVLDPGVEFLAKPFTPSALLRRVRGVLDRTSRRSDAAESPR